MKAAKIIFSVVGFFLWVSFGGWGVQALGGSAVLGAASAAVLHVGLATYLTILQRDQLIRAMAKVEMDATASDIAKARLLAELQDLVSNSDDTAAIERIRNIRGWYSVDVDKLEAVHRGAEIIYRTGKSYE
ncbi:hypothetical protein ACMYSN_22105 [Klebsiella sp. R445]